MSAATGERIKKIREYRSYTQEHMAEKLGISQSAYSRIENGTSKLSTDRLEQIAKALDIPMESILETSNKTFHVDKLSEHTEKGHTETNGTE